MRDALGDFRSFKHMYIAKTQILSSVISVSHPVIRSIILTVGNWTVHLQGHCNITSAAISNAERLTVTIIRVQHKFQYIWLNCRNVQDHMGSSGTKVGSTCQCQLIAHDDDRADRQKAFYIGVQRMFESSIVGRTKNIILTLVRVRIQRAGVIVGYCNRSQFRWVDPNFRI